MSRLRTGLVAVLRSIWPALLLLALPLLSTALVWLQAARQAAPPQPTGDEFTDALLLAVSKPPRELFAPPWVVTNSYLSGGGSALKDPERVLSALREGFADDPRFWELEISAKAATYEDSWAGWEQLIPPLLARLRPLGKAEAERYCRFAVQLDRLRQRTARRAVSDQRPAGTSGVLSWAEQQEVRRLQDADYGAETDELIRSMLAMDPQQAWGYYFAANIRAERGDYAAALEQLATGNRWPSRPGQSWLRATRLELESLELDEPTRVALGLPGLFPHSQSASATLPHSAASQLAKDCLRRGDRRGLQELWQLTAHYYGDEPYRLGLQRQASSRLQDLVGAVSASRLRMSSTEAADWQVFEQAALQLEAEVQAIHSARAAARQQPGTGRELPDTLWVMNFQLANVWQDALDRLPQAGEERELIATRLRPYWDELQRFSFETMSWDGGPPQLPQPAPTSTASGPAPDAEPASH